MRKNAFTLAELVIVIGIIGVLTVLVFGSIVSSRSKGRDVRRITDMKEIQLALAVYFDNNRVYPLDTAALSTLVSQRYMPAIPKDPQTNTDYEYMTSNSGRNYCLGVKLEGTVPSDTASCTSKSSGSIANYKAQK